MWIVWNSWDLIRFELFVSWPTMCFTKGYVHSKVGWHLFTIRVLRLIFVDEAMSFSLSGVITPSH